MKRPAVAVLDLHVQARAKRTEVRGWHGDAIKIKVSAPPVDGAANSALVDFLAEVLGVSKAAVHLESGAGSRRKRVTVRGITRDLAISRLGLA